MSSASCSPIGSVAIPAHNEANVIRHSLDALLTGLAPGELEVVVACNGCTDDTAEIVRSAWPEVRVIELAQASKPAALRAADEALASFPRIYLDADIVLPAASARFLIQTLQTGTVDAARPLFLYDTSRCDPVVRSYYRARQAVIAGNHMLQGGVYGLSRSGRSRFGAYPDIIADDLYASQCFDASEIEVIEAAPAMIDPPRGLGDLIHVSRRRKKGDVELRALSGAATDTAHSTIRSLLSMAVSGPRSSLDALVFAAIATIVRVSVALSSPAGWSRDESSRADPTAAGKPLPAGKQARRTLKLCRPQGRTQQSCRHKPMPLLAASCQPQLPCENQTIEAPRCHSIVPPTVESNTINSLHGKRLLATPRSAANVYDDRLRLVSCDQTVVPCAQRKVGLLTVQKEGLIPAGKEVKALTAHHENRAYRPVDHMRLLVSRSFLNKL
jgi:hypothetical protein